MFTKIALVAVATAVLLSTSATTFAAPGYRNDGGWAPYRTYPRDHRVPVRPHNHSDQGPDGEMG